MTDQKPNNESAWKAAAIMLGIILFISMVLFFSGYLVSVEPLDIGGFKIPKKDFNNLISQVDLNYPATVCDTKTDKCLIIAIRENNGGLG